MKTILALAVTIFLLTPYVSLAEEKDPYAGFSSEGKEYSQALNRAFEANGITNYPLPPLKSELYDKLTEMMIAMNFRASPVEQVLDFYSNLSGMKIEYDDTVSAVRISFLSEGRLFGDEVLRVIRKLLEDQKITLIQQGAGSVKAERILK